MALRSLGCFLLLALAISGSCAHGAEILNCKIVNTPTNITIKVINDCGASVNIRTCPLEFKQCVGYPKSKNYYQDCSSKIPNGATDELVLDTDRRYIVLNCPNWYVHSQRPANMRHCA